MEQEIDDYEKTNEQDHREFRIIHNESLNHIRELKCRIICGKKVWNNK